MVFDLPFETYENERCTWIALNETYENGILWHKELLYNKKEIVHEGC